MCVLNPRFFSKMTKKNYNSSSSSIQSLYQLCKRTFAPSSTQPPPSPAVQKLSSLMDSISPADVGLSENGKEEESGHGLFGVSSFMRVDRWTQPITYIGLHEGEAFTMCIFSFPTSAVIPLHDHPGMTVLSKVLYGSLHVKAYDWVEPACIRKNRETNTTVRLAKLAMDEVVTAPCSASILYPRSGGNVHCFTAITPCAVLDILAPPYNVSAGRSCTYYRDHPYSSFNVNGDGNLNEEDYAWIEEIDSPDIYMRNAPYLGPTLETR